MIATLSRNIIYGKTYAAIEHLGTDATSKIHILIAKKNKGELTIADQSTLSNAEEINEYAFKPRHAHLLINNNQVVQKEIPITSQLPKEALVNQAFPNIDMKAFYYEVYYTETKAYVFICRKIYIDALIQTYETYKVYITGWSLGITSVTHMLSFIDESTIVTSTHTLQVEDNKWIGVTPIEKQKQGINYYSIEGIKVESTYINTLGAAFASMINSDAVTVTNSYDAQKEKQSYYTQNQIFRLGIPVALGILLCVVLINFILYSHYFNQVASLGAIGDANTAQKTLLVKKDSIVSQKQKLFEDVIESASSSSSFYIDRVIDMMPATILLDELQYHPLLKKVIKSKPLAVQENTIVIIGKTTKNSDMSEWISEIEGIDFIEEVSIKSLEKKGAYTHFSVEISIGS